ncbi:amidohydrolase family protein [Ideonella sp. DXS22W]|uniref:Amidohydrolase family protein n=1 Tax=Pseudaquabacterium inlustre TaxID=2984192 RepID=A0ABU9CMB3_9BURK
MTATPNVPAKAPDAVATVVTPDAAWLARQPAEPILDPERPIVDPHHHLWQRRGHRYLLDELLADTGSGHRVVATVFVDCVAFYRADGPVEMKPIGETEFANGVAAMAASGLHGPTRACAGIVSHANLTLGAAVRPVLEAHLRAGNGRFRGIRHAGGWDASPQILDSHTKPPPGLYGEPRFREGFAQLAPLGLSFEAWQYHPQLPDVLALARAFPDTTLVLNHCGGPLGVGPYAGQADAVYGQWRRDLLALAACPNVVVKVGGLGMRTTHFGFDRRPVPPSSQELAAAWKPWVETCIEAFGARRCMFESNFPVDQVSTGYAVLWNAFKRLAAGASADEQHALFAGTAARVYRLDLPPA